VIENQGEDTFSLEEFNDTYEKGFFDGNNKKS
jgi:hypothetical protein